MANKHCPYKLHKVRHDYPKWITPAIVKTMRARDKAFSLQKLEYKFLRSLTQSMVRSSKHKYMRNQLNSNNNTKQWWNTVKTLTKPHPTKPPDSITIEGKSMSSAELCKQLNTYYKSVGGELITRTESPNNSSCKSTPLQHISLGEIKLMLSKIDCSKACTSKDFPSWVSKECREDLCIPIQHIVNTMPSTGEFPNLWKQAEVTPLPKTAKPTSYKDFRPISLLYHLSKVAEQVIINKLKPGLNDIIKSDQYAYQPKIGTVDALLQLVDDITSSIDGFGVKYVQLASIDFSKAFDRLQPQIVIDKMMKYGFNSNIVSIIFNFLSGRKQCVRFGANFSDYINIEVGAPQGTRLGPILWLIFINDLSVDQFQCVKYADDTSFYTTVLNRSTSTIVPAIEKALEWSDDNHMILNNSKTVIMNFYINYLHVHKDPLVIGVNTITPSLSMKFLGVIFDDHLTFNEHIDFIVKNCNSKLFLMRQLRKLGMNNDGLKRFYCANIRSVITYASPVFYQFLSVHAKSRLEKIQRTATKMILPDIPYQQRLRALNLLTIEHFIFQISSNVFKRIVLNPNHPLHSRIIFNSCKKSSRKAATSRFRPKKCRTQKYSKSFFPFFMSFFNNSIF